jgi:methyl-accepting chemotaxis protein
MDQVTQQNAAMVEESTAASRNLASDTAELSEIVRIFDVGSGDAPVRKTSTRAVPHPAPAAPRAAPKPQMKTVATGGRRASGAQAVRAAPQAAAEDWQEF